MRNIRRLIWGLLFLTVAILLVLNEFNVLDFELFFPGWWTLFIIVPSFAGLFEKKRKIDSLVSLGIGIILLLCAQGILEWGMIWKFALPIFIAYIGLKMIFSSFRKNKEPRVIKNIKIDGNNAQRCVAVFCGTDVEFDNVVFEGADLVAVFGEVKCDLRGAIIEKDCYINVVCIFGGVDIKVPNNVRVVNNIPNFFGGTEVSKNTTNATHTIYIDGVCMFGGVDIK